MGLGFEKNEMWDEGGVQKTYGTTKKLEMTTPFAFKLTQFTTGVFIFARAGREVFLDGEDFHR